MSVFPYTASRDRLTANAGALNWATGETVAVKEIQLSNIPKGELGQIMVPLLQMHAPALSSSFPIVGD